MAVNVAPTKSNLMNSKSSLEFSKKGYELLDKKRNVLIHEMMGMIGRAKKIQDEVEEVFADAYEALKTANMTEGISDVEAIAMSVDESSDYEVLLRSVMGVEIPSIKIKREEIQPTFSFYRTNNAFDIALLKFQEVKYLSYELAEVENAVYRLAMEIKKTQKRANALQNIQIPRFTEIVKYIREVLDEKEREDFFRLKMVKRRTGR